MARNLPASWPRRWLRGAYVSLRAGLAHGGDGQDTISGEDGHDLMFGGDNADSIYGDDGNDVLIGGQGRDSMDGGFDRDSVFAKESDFPLNDSDPNSGPQPDEIDPVVDCGDSSDEQYVTTSPGQDADGNPEAPNGCQANPALPPFVAPTLSEILSASLTAGSWPWFR